MRKNLLILIIAAGTMLLFVFRSNVPAVSMVNNSYADSLQASNDSLKILLVKMILTADSLHGRIRQRDVLIRITKLKCNRYANIVKKNPSQSIFIVAWIDRSFQWVDEKGEE